MQFFRDKWYNLKFIIINHHFTEAYPTTAFTLLQIITIKQAKCHLSAQNTSRSPKIRKITKPSAAGGTSDGSFDKPPRRPPPPPQSSIMQIKLILIDLHRSRLQCPDKRNVYPAGRPPPPKPRANSRTVSNDVKKIDGTSRAQNELRPGNTRGTVDFALPRASYRKSRPAVANW